MSKLSRFAAASPFAHFLGLTGLAARAAGPASPRKCAHGAAAANLESLLMCYLNMEWFRPRSN